MIHVCYCCDGIGEGIETDRQTDRQTDKQTDKTERLRHKGSQKQKSETAISPKICRLCVRVIINNSVVVVVVFCCFLTFYAESETDRNRQKDRENK